MTRLLIESRAPNWKRTNDLRQTRIKDANRGQLLLFKYMEWQTLRIEAKAETNIVQTPLRLITNQASCRLTLKKRLSDCSFLGARLMLIFDDLLWVLTDAQLLSALHFADYLGELIQNAPRTHRFNDELFAIHSPTKHHSNAHNAQTVQNQVGQLFARYDVLETSHHIYVSRIEIHLCDELDPSNSRSLYPPLEKGGALQVSIFKLVIDIYPYQKVLGNRKHWIRYSDPSASRSQWIDQLLQLYVDDKLNVNVRKENQIKPSPRSQTLSILNHLRSRVILLRFSNYSLNCVSTYTTTKEQINEKFIATDKTAFSLPDDMDAFYMEINNYYFVDGDLTTPNPTAFIHLTPLKICFDANTIIWINAFQANLQKAMEKLQEMLPKNQQETKLCTRIECLMPVVIFKCPENEIYSSFEIKSTKIIATNCNPDSTNLRDLNKLKEKIGLSSLFYDRDSFPWLSTDTKPISDLFIDESNENNENLFEIWSVDLQPFWIEFVTRNTNKGIAFVDPLPVTLWALVCSKDAMKQLSPENPEISIIISIPTTIRIQINHFQFIFLMRFLDVIGDFGMQINQDTLMILGGSYDVFTKLSLVLLIDNLELILILKEEFNNKRSVGVSPHSSTNDVSPLDENMSIHSDVAALAVVHPSSSLPKSCSDSLISTSNNESNNELHSFEDKQKNFNSQPVSAATSISSFQQKLISPNNLQRKTQLNNATLRDVMQSRSIDTGFSEFSVLEDDNRSIRSDISGDSDQFILVGLETTLVEEDIFSNKIETVEAAEEVKEDSVDDTQSNEITNNDALNSDLPISLDVFRIKLSDLNMVKQSFGYNSSIFLTIANVFLNEHMKMSYEDFISVIVNRKNEQMNQCMNETDLNPTITARIDTVEKPNLKDDLISAVLVKLNATINMETALSLNDFITDEEATKVPLVNVLFDKVMFTLIDEKVCTPPLTLKLPYCLLERNTHNQVTIEPIVQGNCFCQLFSFAFQSYFYFYIAYVFVIQLYLNYYYFSF